jgi:restriction endonuclease S subunit
MDNTLNDTTNIETIGKIADTDSGGTPLKKHQHYYAGGSIPWLNSGEVNGEIYESTNFITEEGLKNSNAKKFPKGSLLIAMYGATAGKVGILNFESTTNQAICALLPNSGYSTKFMYYQLKLMYKELLALRTGVARDNLSQEKIRAIKIKKPDITIQNDVVNEIEIIESKIKRVNNRLSKIEKMKIDVMNKYLNQ